MKNKNFRLSIAKKNDSRYFYNLRNNISTRKMSFNKKKIKLSDHSKWFNHQIKLRGFLWIFFSKAKKCGAVYLKKNKYLEIGYIISPKQRGMGYSSVMLNLFIKKFKKYNKKKEPIFAKVFNNNLKSLRALQSAGFIINKTKKNIKILKLKYV